MAEAIEVVPTLSPSLDALGRLREAKAWIFDMDGVLYRGAEVLPGVKELLDALTLRERPVMLATNNSMSTPEAYEHKLKAMGLGIPASAVITSALAAIAAESDAGEAIGGTLVDVTREGEKCTTFEQCKTLLEDGEDIDYDGISGPIELSDKGDPTSAVVGIYTYGPDNKLTAEVDYQQGELE